MNTQRAMSDIRDIGDILARAQHTSCFRPLPIATTALIAIFAALLSASTHGSSFVGESSFVGYWLAVACLNAMILAGDLAIRFWKTESELQRGKTRVAIYQFSPSLLIGAYATICLLPAEEHPGTLLPGLWCLITSLGIFATLSNAPPSMVFPAAFYAIVGGLYLRFDEWAVGLGPWSMGLAFGIGQAWVALVLWRGFKHD